MKKIILSLLLSFPAILSNAQNGLENIIVEKYYISNENDTTTNLDGGVLPVGSVTYRIYVDLLPGYKFQAAFGIPGHELRFATTTSFFNNEDRGAMAPTYTKTQASHNTVMLDSWFSSGGACTGNLGILKSEDNGIANVVNSDGVLQNADPLAGIPLTSQDGLIAGTPEDVTMVGITSEASVFDAATTGNVFSTFNGSWASLNGSVGPTPANKVLIAQMTTDGIFSFLLNIQIGTPSGGVQQYVASNPTGSQVQMPGLTYENIPEFSLNIKAFLQGFYIGGGSMNASIDPVLYPDDADTVVLQLAGSSYPYAITSTSTSILHTDGSVQFRLLRDIVGSSQYIVMKHRNAIETWSASPVLITANIKYDFSDAANKAYGNNLSDLGDGNFGFYSGDISDAGTATIGIQDGIMESQDYSDMENAVNNILTGYVAQDITGDGVVESGDYSILENNVSFVIFTNRP